MRGKIEGTNILNRIGKEEILPLAQKIWQGQNEVATEIASEALAIIREKYEIDPTFFSGKRAKGIVGGLFYLLGHRCGNLRTQRQIALNLNTTEVTIRASCREWAEPLQRHYRHSKTK
jgi:transcription initiation factor TFIIIB Brf1 subunit/transcription initiation factor TFIIB